MSTLNEAVEKQEWKDGSSPLQKRFWEALREEMQRMSESSCLVKI
jgi:hypothetical protein